MSFIDGLLNRITMYRLMFYYLLALLAIAAIFGAFGILPYNPLSLLLSTLILLLACLLANKIFAKVFRAQTNIESAYITAFILALIITPISFQPFDSAGFAFLLWAAVFAMASKYILAIKKKHIFNPAAFAVALTAIVINQYASWWIGGNLTMLAFVVIGGLLVVRKIQRFDLVLTFFIAAIASVVFTNLSFDPVTTAEKALIHTSILFVGFVMMTEPLTSPPTRALRMTYAAIVGALFAPTIHIGPIYSTPELAIVVGNIFSYIVSPKGKYLLKLDSKKEVGTNIYDFSFSTGNARINFQSGQYMEWTLSHADADSRGNRRYFTIASSPTESELRLGVKFYEKSSSFKKKMRELEPGDTLMGGNLAGDFTLPHDPARKLAFIAGGIGITPFRSMTKFLSDRTKISSSEKRNVILLYSNRLESEIAYREIFDEAKQTIGMKTVYIITGQDKKYIDAKLIETEIPDYRERTFYISGTHTMVVAFEKTLHELGIPRTHIKIDFFPGFA